MQNGSEQIMSLSLVRLESSHVHELEIWWLLAFLEHMHSAETWLLHVAERCLLSAPRAGTVLLIPIPTTSRCEICDFCGVVSRTFVHKCTFDYDFRTLKKIKHNIFIYAKHFFFIFKETHSMNEMRHGWFIYRIPFPFSLCLCSWIASIWFRPRPLQPCIVRWWPAVAGWHHLSPSLFRPNFLMPLCCCHEEHSWALKLS